MNTHVQTHARHAKNQMEGAFHALMGGLAKIAILNAFIVILVIKNRELA